MIKTYAVGDLQTNCHFLIDEETLECAVIDPGAEPDRLIEQIRSQKLKVTLVINTHGHGDHIGANGEIRDRYQCKILIHRLDARMLANPEQNLSSSFYPAGIKSPSANTMLEDGGIITLGKYQLKVIHTPGHTPGSICLEGDDFVFTGDTLFCGSVGRWDLPGGDAQMLKNSVKRLSRLPPSLKIYPGHGPSCVMKDELRHNPFFTDMSLYD